VPRAYATYEEVFADQDVDAVYVATPHSMHQHNCIQALESGKAVLCEKPFAINAREAQEVIRLAREKQVFCMEAMRMRFFPLFARLLALIDDGLIGELQMLTADFSIPTPFDANSRVFDPSLGGGAWLERGVYCLSLATRILGAPSDVVGRASIGETGVDEETAVVLTFPNGPLAILTASLRSHGANAAMIMGSEGTIRIHQPFYQPYRLSVAKFPRFASSAGRDAGLKQLLRHYAERLPRLKSLYLRVRDCLPKSYAQIVEAYDGNGYQYEAEEVMRCLRTGDLESEIMPLDETLSIMQAMDRIRRECDLRYPQD